jgi:TolB-like protein
MSDSAPTPIPPHEPRSRADEPYDPAPPSRRLGGLLELFAELKQRRVLRVAGMYCVAAWLAMQVADVVFPALDFPDGAVALVVVLVLLGFPVALVLAWLFDLTDAGEVRAAPGGSRSAAALMRGGTPLLAVGVIVAVIVAASGAWYALGTRAPVASQGGGDEGVARVAILYLEHAPDDAGLAAFASGLTSNLITELQRVPGLHVVSENGVRPFRGRSVPVDSIGLAVSANTLVGGSISRSGNTIRVNAQLIDAASGRVLAARQIQRQEGELFGLVDDVSHEVSLLLRQHLGHEVRLSRIRAGTGSEEAWQLVQRAINLVHEAHSLRTAGDHAGGLTLLARSDSLLATAETHDRRWVEPIVQRGWVARHRAFANLNAGRRDPAEIGASLDIGLRHADRALLLASDDAAALELRGMLRHAWVWLLEERTAPRAVQLLEGAEADLRRAIRNDASRVRAWTTLSAILHDGGQLEESVRAAERAYAADAFAEQSTENLIRLFEITFDMGRDTAAAEWCGELTRRAPGHWPSVFCELMLLGWSLGDPEAVARAQHRLLSFGRDDPAALRAVMSPRLTMLYAGVLARNGLADSARSVIASARRAAPADPDLLQLEAGVRVILDEQDAAAELLQRYFESSLAQRDIFRQNRRFAALRDHAFWSAGERPAVNSR